jgi:drug/metabolite transporter (DMT)-like permease
VAPLDYTGLIWATAIGWIFWNDLLTLPMLIGAAIVVASCLYILKRGEKKKAA